MTIFMLSCTPCTSEKDSAQGEQIPSIQRKPLFRMETYNFDRVVLPERVSVPVN